MISREDRVRGGKMAAAIVKQKHIDSYLEHPNYWLYCNKMIEIGHQRVSYVKRKKFCNSICFAKFNNIRAQKTQLKKVKREYLPKESVLSQLTKKELFLTRKNWQSARSLIQRLARKKLISLGLLKECYVCGYTKHVEACHKKSVKDFSDITLIKEINSPENLVALCPNHHWEFDNGFLIL